MKFIRALLLFYVASLSLVALSAEVDIPAPDNPSPLPPMPPPDNPSSAPSLLEKELNKQPIYINRSDLTNLEMQKIKKFGELELHREIRFNEK